MDASSSFKLFHGEWISKMRIYSNHDVEEF